MDLTPEKIFTELRQTVVGQDEFLKTLSSAAWLHSLRFESFMNTGEKLDDPRHILCIGQSGTGKTLAIKKMGEYLGLPVIIQDASALRGAGWKGQNVSNIIARIAEIAGNQAEGLFSIVCLDEIDKVFRSRSQMSENSFLPLDNLLTFLSGGIVTHSDSNRSISLNTSQMLVICLGAFEGLEDIIAKRLSGEKTIGFSAKSNGHAISQGEDVLEYLTDDDLLNYGVPTEFLGRIATVTRTSPLTMDAYKRILTESKASPIRQLDSLLQTSINARVSITDSAIKHIAEKAMQAKTGARTLSRTVMETLQPAIYDLPGDSSISALVLDADGDRLYARYVHGARPSIQKHKQENEPEQFPDQLSEIEKDILKSVPFYCQQQRDNIIAYAANIQKAYRHIRHLPQMQQSAAATILAASIASKLYYDSTTQRNTMLYLYTEIDIIGTEYADEDDAGLGPHHLKALSDEFLSKAPEYESELANAKETAKIMLLDYCKSYLAKQEYA